MVGNSHPLSSLPPPSLPTHFHFQSLPPSVKLASSVFSVSPISPPPCIPPTATSCWIAHLSIASHHAHVLILTHFPTLFYLIRMHFHLLWYLAQTRFIESHPCGIFLSFSSLPYIHSCVPYRSIQSVPRIPLFVHIVVYSTFMHRPSDCLSRFTLAESILVDSTRLNISSHVTPVCGNKHLVNALGPTLQPGTRVVSFFFTIGGWEHSLVKTDSKYNMSAYLCRCPLHGGKQWVV